MVGAEPHLAYLNGQLTQELDLFSSHTKVGSIPTS